MRRLPDCYARREVPDDPHRVYCLHPMVHARGDIIPAEMCKLCNYWREPSPGPLRPFPPPPVIDNVGPCVYLGEETGLRECTTCLGRVRVKVFACRHPSHDETTFNECRHCPDHQRPDRQPPSASQADPLTTHALNSEAHR
jgi:hypothetical protein